VIRALGIATLALAAASCGGGQTSPKLFSSEWEDDAGGTIERVRQRLAGVHLPRGADVAVGVAGRGDQIVGVPLATGTKWSYAHALDARPAVTGGVVVGSGSGEVFALDALTGRPLWARPTGGLALRGAGDDGSVTVVTFASQDRGGSVLLAVTRDGHVARQIETDKPLGIPAVAQGLAFVPWGEQYVSVVDLASGDEAARVTLRTSTSHAWLESDALFFGQSSIVRFDSTIRGASRDAASKISLPKRDLPGTPMLMFPGTEHLSPVASARDEARLYARPTPAPAPLAFDSSRFYATYFRFVMGLDAATGSLAWVHTHPSRVLGGAAASGALVTCDEGGKVTFLDAKTGIETGGADLGAAIRSCVVQVDGFVPPRGSAEPEGIAAQLERAVATPDAELVTAQTMFLQELASSGDESATRTIIGLATDARTAPELRKQARSLIASRRAGAKYMLEALALRYDYLKDVLVTPPVAPIAQALAAMSEPGAAPLLAAHILDPADSDEDVREAAAALTSLATASEAPELEHFFAMYRATAPNDDIAAAVASVARALARLDPKKGRARIDFALKDPETAPAVAPRLQAVVDALDAKPTGNAGAPAPASSQSR
jgi:outer membrane protein assembly factor BamB